MDTIKIVLDDQPERFNNLPYFNSAVFVTDNKMAMYLINEAAFFGIEIDELWLDHDLGDDANTMGTVDYICELASNKAFPIKKVFVHSMNPSAAQTIMLALKRWDIPVSRNIPFI